MSCHSYAIICDAMLSDDMFCPVAWRNAGRSLKGFGIVPQVTACEFTIGFRVGKVRAPCIDRLGFVPKRYCIDFVGAPKCTKTQWFF